MFLKPPRLAGPALSAIRRAAEAPASHAAVREIFKRTLGIDELARLPDDARGDMPLDAHPIRARKESRAREDAKLGAPRSDRSWPRASGAFLRAYAEKVTTPEKVVEHALAELETLKSRRPTMNVLVSKDDEAALRDAKASALRWARGEALGPLDGVPFVVKDQQDVAGLSTRLGSRCEPDAPRKKDATLVARLRQAGAIVLGKTVLTEWGMSPIGANASYAMPHNVHDSTRAAGGSSTGSAVAVALGVCPFATGGDGGGSIRIPAALNGIFGIKPTFGRVSREGDGFLGSVAHPGPIASSTADLAAFLDAVASEPDSADPLTARALPPPLGGFGALLGAGVRGLRIGIDEEEWKDAAPAIVRACREALSALEREGAKLVDVRMPLAKHAARVGYLTIGPESLASVRHHWLERRHMINDDVRLSFAVLSGITAVEQLDAQRLRAALRKEMASVLREVDLVALPTTAMTAPRFTEADALTSFSDPEALDGLCRYAFLGNLTGLPAGTAPIGLDPDGLPIGLQLIGDAWDEATVLAALAHLERMEVANVVRPPGAIDLLL